MAIFESVAATFRYEIAKIRGSRFITTVEPIADDNEIFVHKERLRAEFPLANHHCWAWRGRDRQHFRCSDDGEPHGSAGMPILKAIEGRGLVATAVFVSRIFGGTQLGIGGLVRAYSSAATQALDCAPRRQTVLSKEVHLTYDYAWTSVIQANMHAFALTLTHADYSDIVRQIVQVPDENVAAFLRAVQEACAGEVEIRVVQSRPT